MSTPSRLRVFVWLEQIGQDLRYALRQFACARGFTFVAVATLALGIGATTAIFSVVDAVLLHPIPGRDADRVVQVGEWVQYSNRRAPDLAGLSPATGEALAVTSRDFFADVAWADSSQLDRRGDDFSTLVFGAAVSENFFTLFGAKPAVGRGFAAGEGVPANHGTPEKGTVIVLSDSWWRAEFGADPKVLGQSIELSGQRHTIVGVMPAYFQFPNAGAKFWLPTAPPRLQPRSIGAPNLKLFARLKPGVDVNRTQAMLDTLAQRLMRDHPAGDKHYGDWWRTTPAGLRLWCRSLAEVMQSPIYAPRFEDLRRTLFGFLAAIGFVLAIVCANVASLTLARTERREHELAVRAAVGAGRWRLMRQLLTENVLLAVAGGLAGLVVTRWAIQALAAFSTMPRLRPIEVDARVFGVALVVALVTGLASGLAPAWHAGRARVQHGLQQGGFAATSGRRGGFVRDALVVMEVALAMVLLTGAGLMVASVMRLLHVDPGYDPVNLAVVAPDFTGRTSLKNEQRNAFIDQLRARLAALPGVVAVGVFKDNYREERFTVEGRTEPVLLYGANAGIEEADYFRAARVALVAGRLLTRDDVGEGSPAIVINETLAELCWPGRSALGQKLRSQERRGEPQYEVVGVVRDTRTSQLSEPVRPIFYRPFAESQLTGSRDQLFVRTERDPAPLVAAMRHEVHEVNPTMRQPSITISQQMLFDATAAQRTYLNYLMTFAGVGLLLAAIGIYGVLAQAVARRTREIGIRMALGADRRAVIGLILGDGARLIALGIAVGLTAAYWLTQLLQKQLFGVKPHDLGVQAAVVAVLAAIGLIACWLPARRAAKVDPIVALRAE